MTDFFEPFVAHGYEKAIEIEAMQGKNLARAASKIPTLKHYIWSTLPNGEKLTNGKWRIPHFVAKNVVDDFIKQDKSLLAKTTFFWITFYANNFQYPIFTPNLLVRRPCVLNNRSLLMYRTENLREIRATLACSS